MGKIDAMVKKYIPEAIKWELMRKYSVEVVNPDNSVLDGLYVSYVISYVDSYEAKYFEVLSFKNNKYFGRESEYRKIIQPIEILGICQLDTDIYQLCTKYTNEDQRSALIFGLLERDNLNKNTSIRDYVTINEQENKKSMENLDILREIYDCVKENNRLLVNHTNITTNHKIFLRSIGLLAKSMVGEEKLEARKKTADEICELLEDYIADANE